MGNFWQRVRSWWSHSDAEHIARIRRDVATYERWRRPLIALYITLSLALVGLAVALVKVLNGLQQLGAQGGWAGFVVGAVFGISFGGLIVKCAHGLEMAFFYGRTERLLIQYHDALAELYLQEPEDQEPEPFENADGTPLPYCDDR